MKKQQSVTLCGETLYGPNHICAFFSSRDEQYATLLPWIKDGLDNNEEVFNILHKDLHGDHCSRLADAGVAVEETLNRGQLKILASEESYLHGGSFAAERMTKLLEQALINAQSGPYGKFRGYGEMEWALKNLPGTDELMEYEARINTYSPKYDCSIICAYDITRISGSAISDILATHQYVIMNGRLHKNPHYIEPIEFLGKLIKRPKKPLAGTTNG